MNVAETETLIDAMNLSFTEALRTPDGVDGPVLVS